MLLDYLPGDSFLHKLNPITKLLIALLLCAACFVTTSHILILGIIALNIVMAAMCGAGKSSLRIVTSLLKLSCILFIVQVLVTRSGNIILRLPINLYITDVGLRFSLLFILRLISAALPLTLMLRVTQDADLTNALTQCLRVPYKYSFALSTAIRFIPTFSDEMSEIMEAQTARGIEFDTKNFFKKLKLLLPLCLPLLLSSVRKIEVATISAELRGFQLRTRESSYKKYPFKANDALAGVICAALVAVAYFA
jgi:energy-coupling factor transport system permease protein